MILKFLSLLRMQMFKLRNILCAKFQNTVLKKIIVQKWMWGCDNRKLFIKPSKRARIISQYTVRIDKSPSKETKGISHILSQRRWHLWWIHSREVSAEDQREALSEEILGISTRFTHQTHNSTLPTFSSSNLAWPYTLLIWYFHSHHRHGLSLNRNNLQQPNYQYLSPFSLCYCHLQTWHALY